ncbi:uncharacterized protein LOC135705242 [Ochlerotatus camptorhynchus]|uniref:uncharacterized protein LOC135705242 n=1 Tax=Ochlerotatus camptorhynchus TaxID=644619 RepID=UPI0031E3A7A3
MEEQQGSKWTKHHGFTGSGGKPNHSGGGGSPESPKPSGSGVKPNFSGDTGVKPSLAGVSEVKSSLSGSSVVKTSSAGGSGSPLGRPNKPVIDNIAPVIPQMMVLRKNTESKPDPNVQNAGSQKAATSTISTTGTVLKDSSGATTGTPTSTSGGDACETTTAMEDEVSEQQRYATIKRPGAMVTESSESEEVSTASGQQKMKHGLRSPIASGGVRSVVISSSSSSSSTQ